MREPGLRERGPEDDSSGRGGRIQRTQRQWERGLTTDAQMHDARSPATLRVEQGEN